MKRILLGMTALVAMGSYAQAADLAPKLYTKAPHIAPVANWTGFYVFGGAGYGMWTDDQNTIASGVEYQSIRSGGRGWFGTVGGGYDYQFSPSWVAGIFADAQFGDIKGTLDWYQSYYVGSTTNRRNYAAGARLGYLVAPNVLSYVNAGYSHAEFSGVDHFGLYYGGLSVDGAPKRSFDGWFIGGGVENSLDLFGISAPGWFMKTEYRVAEYGRKYSAYLNSAGPVDPADGLSTKPYVQTISTSLVYRFNWTGAPVRVASSPLNARAQAIAPINWTGFYLSGGGGYGLWAADSQVSYLAIPYVPNRTGGRGYFGTAGGGYDYQINSSWVAGIFADAQFGNIKGTFTSYPDGYDVYSGPTKNKVSYAAGARLGYLVAPNVLSYVNAGYSHAEFTGSLFYYDEYALPKQHYNGWFVGGGVENSLNLFGISAPGWFMKTEYRLAEYGRKTMALTDASGAPYSDWSLALKPYVQTVSTSLVYRFNWGAPAKY